MESKNICQFTFLSLVLMFFFSSFMLGQEGGSLLIKPGDLRLVPEFQETEFDVKEKQVKGYHLFIRKKAGLESVILTETTKDPEMREPNYAYRALEYNEINGDEKRLLDGKFLTSEYSKYSLTSSTVIKDAEFGEAFHIYIPKKMQYGYPWSRHGEVEIGAGVFINIRAFSKKFNNYEGAFFDNPYMFDLEKELPASKTPSPLPTIEDEDVPLLTDTNLVPPVSETEKEPEKPKENLVEPAVHDTVSSPIPSILTDDYNPDTARKFREFSRSVIFSKGVSTITSDIMKTLSREPQSENLDVVFAIDATGSMKSAIDTLRKEWIGRLKSWAKRYKSLRVGLLLYRDYVDSYRYKGIPVKFFNFTKDLETFEKNLNAFIIRGKEGGDIPEAVYEALFGAVTFYGWNPLATHKVILIGDAPPHPTPRGSGKYTKELVSSLARKNDILIDAIITPDDKKRRGR